MTKITNSSGRNKSGIYLISNSQNNDIYIGSAINLYNRMCNHLYDLRLNKHHSPYLQRTYNKYGEIFLFIIIEYCSKNHLVKREQFWINYYNPKYNCKYISVF